MTFNFVDSKKTPSREQGLLSLNQPNAQNGQGVVRSQRYDLCVAKVNLKQSRTVTSIKGVQGIITLSCTHNNSHLQYKSYVDNFAQKASAGSIPKGTIRKKALYANSLLGEAFGAKLCERGVSHVNVLIYNFGRGRDGTLSGLRKSGLHMHILKQCAAQPHNGCRPPKIRRL